LNLTYCTSGIAALLLLLLSGALFSEIESKRVITNVYATQHIRPFLDGFDPVSPPLGPDIPREGGVPEVDPIVRHTPDMGFQLSICLPEGNNLLSKIIDALRNHIVSIPRDPRNPDSPPRWPTPDIRVACVDGTQRIGIWVTTTENPEINAAREQAYRQISIVRPGETFAMFIWGPFIQRQSQQLWNELPKEPFRGVHLTYFTAGLGTQNIISTSIWGYAEAPITNTDFILTFTDIISVTNFIHFQRGTRRRTT
jgi:hypothetical protein